MNIFRVNWKMERLFPESLTGDMDETYLGDLREVRGIAEGLNERH